MNAGCVQCNAATYAATRCNILDSRTIRCNFQPSPSPQQLRNDGCTGRARISNHFRREPFLLSLVSSSISPHLLGALESSVCPSRQFLYFVICAAVGFLIVVPRSTKTSFRICWTIPATMVSKFWHSRSWRVLHCHSV